MPAGTDRALVLVLAGGGGLMLVSLQMLPKQPASELLDAIVLADELSFHDHALISFADPFTLRAWAGCFFTARPFIHLVAAAGG